MRFINKNSFRLSTMYLSKKKDFRKYLTTILHLNSNEIEHIFDKNKSLHIIPRHRVINNCMMLQKYNVDIMPIRDLRSCLYLTNQRLEHKINVLKDIGIPNLNISLIAKINYLFKEMKLSKFKNTVNIPIDQSIAKNIFSRLGNEIPNNIYNLELNDTLTVDQFYKTCLLHCKSEIFDLPYLDEKIIWQNYGKLKSLSMIAETLKVLRNDLSYDDKMIKKYPFVITCSAEDIRLLLNSFDNICGIPIVTILRDNPRILFQDSNNIKQLLLSLKQYGIPDERIRKYTKILLLGNDTFLERMAMIKRHSELHVWLGHPRILDMVLHMNMLKDRVSFLNGANRLKWARPHMILSKRVNLEKLLQTNSSITMTKKALKYMFLKELGTDNNDLINMLTRHKNWKSIGFVEINEMLKYLKQHFEISEICHNIHIILHPQSKVKKVLANLKQQYANSTEYSFTNGQYLALCLYTLEKNDKGGFTDNNSIWDGRNIALQQTLNSLNSENNISDDTDILDDSDLNKTSDSIHDNFDDDECYST